MADERFAAWATSPDHAVSVLAVPGGVPLEVHLSAGALRMRPDTLARSVLETALAAGRRATAELHRELAAAVGPDAARTLDRVGLPALAAGPDDGPGGPGAPDDCDDPDDPDDPGHGPGRIMRSVR